MITNEGKIHMKRYMAEQVPSIIRSLSLGIGSAAESANDAYLQLETVRSPVHLTSYDFVNNKIVYKAEIPQDYAGIIYEVGGYSLEYNPMAGGYDSRIITNFDSGSEEWLDSGGNSATFSTSNTRVGTDSLLFSNAASANKTWMLNELELDLSGYSSADLFKFAFNCADANTSAIRVRFKTDGSNYYDFNLGSQTAGYKIVNATKASATTTGTPSWSTITSIEIYSAAGAGGAQTLTFDAIRIEDVDTINLDYVLVARKVLASPITKIEGQAQDIEFSLASTI